MSEQIEHLLLESWHAFCAGGQGNTELAYAIRIGCLTTVFIFAGSALRGSER